MSKSTAAKGPTCSAYLIRHGATEANLAQPPILQGRSIDGPLSLPGRQQAEAAAFCLHEEPIAAVYCSPLKRAVETAQIVAAPHKSPIHIHEELTEVDVGAWERRSWVEIAQTEPAAYQAFQRDPAAHGYPAGENLQQVFERVNPVLRRILAKH
ncbi:MAG: histidine phosphatase family protein, partial [Planctomycetales bacterium]|nr:histidine phosphatase family protein [Planctomycetales bacterium]